LTRPGVTKEEGGKADTTPYTLTGENQQYPSGVNLKARRCRQIEFWGTDWRGGVEKGETINDVGRRKREKKRYFIGRSRKEGLTRIRFGQLVIRKKYIQGEK